MAPKVKRNFILILTCVFYLACLYATLNLRLNEKITALLPEKDADVISFTRVMTQVPAAETLYIQISAPRTDLLEKAGDDFYAAVKDSPFFTDIVYRFSPDSVLALMDFIRRNKYWLFNEEDISRLDRLMQKENLPRLLSDIKRKLLDPSSAVSASTLAGDPFGMEPQLLKHLTAFQSEMPGIRASNSRMVSSDGKSLLIMAAPAFPAVDTRQSRKLFDFLNREKTALVTAFGEEVRVGFSGVHPATLDNSTTIQSDVKRAILVLTAGILALGFLFFSRIYHVILIFLPTLVSLTFATAAAGLFSGEVSAIALGCGAVLMGITVDFGIHVLFHVDTLGTSHTHSILHRLRPPVTTGAATTMAAFACLFFSSLPGQRQMGWIAVTGIMGAALFTLFILKHFIMLRPRPAGTPLISLVRLSNGLMAFRKKHVKLLMAACLVLLGTGAAGLENFRFDGDVSSLNHLSPATQRDMDRFLSTWGQGSPSIFMVESPDMETALEKNDALFDILKGMETDRLLANTASLSQIFPSVQKREVQLASFMETFPLERIGLLEKEMEAACVSQGFSRTAFAPFFKEIRQFYDQPPLHFSYDDFIPLVIFPLVKSKLIMKEDKVMVLTTAAVEDKTAIPGIKAGLAAALPGTLFLDKPHFIQRVTALVADEFKRFIFWAALSMVIVLLILQRDIKRVVITILPVTLSAVITAGLLGLAGISINLISIIFIIFVFGVGVDFSIFLVHHAVSTERSEDHITTGAVMICAMTTIAAFGCLVFARHNALFSIGAAGMTGMLVCLFLAVVLIPSLAERWLVRQQPATGRIGLPERQPNDI
ncbi:MAG: MMPL family transporter [Desulfobacterales bacterium]|nr:MMPL family transporter [Desulfobacterales bacterium]